MTNLPAIDALSIEDLKRLVEAKVPEGLELEYKQQLPAGSDEAKREFLADLTSFANTAGGYLLFGLEEERDSDGRATGAPKRVAGLGGVINASLEIGRLENLTRDAIEPRVAGIRWREVVGAEDGSIIACWIPRSWQLPHMVTYQRLSRFFGRNSSGKYQLNVGEIRSLVLAAEELPERVRRFRGDRLVTIAANDGPIPVRAGSRYVIHVVAAASLLTPNDVGVPLATANLSPLGSGGWNDRFNVDGRLTYSPDKNGEAWSYAQIFRNGAIESVKHGDAQGIASVSVEVEFARAALDYLQALAKWRVPAPWFLILSFLGVKGTRLHIRDYADFYDRGVIDRDALLMPEIIVESGPPNTVEEALSLLHPAFDVLWQSAGYERCFHFREDGSWKA